MEKAILNVGNEFEKQKLARAMLALADIFLSASTAFTLKASQRVSSLERCRALALGLGLNASTDTGTHFVRCVTALAGSRVAPSKELLPALMGLAKGAALTGVLQA